MNNKERIKLLKKAKELLLRANKILDECEKAHIKATTGE